jgi:hypothetical protein
MPICWREVENWDFDHVNGNWHHLYAVKVKYLSASHGTIFAESKLFTLKFPWLQELDTAVDLASVASTGNCRATRATI